MLLRDAFWGRLPHRPIFGRNELLPLPTFPCSVINVHLSQNRRVYMLIRLGERGRDMPNA